MKDIYPMGIPYCGYANMGMPAREIKELEFFSLKKSKEIYISWNESYESKGRVGN